MSGAIAGLTRSNRCMRTKIKERKYTARGCRRFSMLNAFGSKMNRRMLVLHRQIVPLSLVEQRNPSTADHTEIFEALIADHLSMAL
jgi:hypothetical protein